LPVHVGAENLALSDVRFRCAVRSDALPHGRSTQVDVPAVLGRRIGKVDDSFLNFASMV